MANPNPAHHFKKGRSGNPNGRPKRDWTWSGLLADAMEEADTTGESYKKVIIKKVRALAAKGDMIAVKELFNRMDGMPQQDVTSAGEKIEGVVIYKPEKNIE